MDAERGSARPRAFVTVYGVVVNSRKIVERTERKIGIATTTTETRPAWLRNEHARHVMRAKRANHALHQEELRNTWRTFEKYNALGASCFSAGRTRPWLTTWINSIYVKTIGRIPLPFQKILSSTSHVRRDDSQTNIDPESTWHEFFLSKLFCASLCVYTYFYFFAAKKYIACIIY